MNSIFKAYDIRGKYPAEVNEAVAEKIGAAAAIFLEKRFRPKRKIIFVCRDVRESSLALKNALLKGIISQGYDAADLGQGTTPFFYYAMERGRPAGGIMVTASHNPAEYNGFKLQGPMGREISIETGLAEIAQLAKSDFTSVPTGQVSEISGYQEDYIKFLAGMVRIAKPVRLAIDAAGGSAAFFLPRLLAKFSKVIYKPVFFEPDGGFANHPPNPLDPKVWELMRREMQSGRFHFGAAFDGDGDRVIFFDEKGRAVKSEFIGALFFEEEFKKNRRGPLVLPANTSRGVREYIREMGGKVKLTRIGYPFVQQTMRKLGSPIGVEVSGHFHFKNFFWKDSALLAMLYLARIFAKNPRPLSLLIEPFNRYHSSGELNFEVKDKEEALEKIKRRYRAADKAKVSEIDGFSADFPEWWFNIRSSNTEPLVRLVVEAKTEVMLRERLSELKNIVSG